MPIAQTSSGPRGRRAKLKASMPVKLLVAIFTVQIKPAEAIRLPIRTSALVPISRECNTKVGEVTLLLRRPAFLESGRRGCGSHGRHAARRYRGGLRLGQPRL